MTLIQVALPSWNRFEFMIPQTKKNKKSPKGSEPKIEALG
jgi:hypothetical protein